MSFEVIEEHSNALLGRREAKVMVHHEGSGTPDRITVRKMASEHYKTDLDRVFVKSISTGTGQSQALCIVEVYNDTKSTVLVPAYVKNRNLPKDQRTSKGKKKEQKSATAPPAPKPVAEKKAEPKPAEKKEEAKPAPAKDAKPPPAKEARPAAKPEAKPKT